MGEPTQNASSPRPEIARGFLAFRSSSASDADGVSADSPAVSSSFSRAAWNWLRQNSLSAEPEVALPGRATVKLTDFANAGVRNRQSDVCILPAGWVLGRASAKGSPTAAWSSALVSSMQASTARVFAAGAPLFFVFCDELVARLALNGA